MKRRSNGGKCLDIFSLSAMPRGREADAYLSISHGCEGAKISGALFHKFYPIVYFASDQFRILRVNLRRPLKDWEESYFSTHKKLLYRFYKFTVCGFHVML